MWYIKISSSYILSITSLVSNPRDWFTFRQVHLLVCVSPGFVLHQKLARAFILLCIHIPLKRGGTRHRLSGRDAMDGKYMEVMGKCVMLNTTTRGVKSLIKLYACVCIMNVLCVRYVYTLLLCLPPFPPLCLSTCGWLSTHPKHVPGIIIDVVLFRPKVKYSIIRWWCWCVLLKTGRMKEREGESIMCQVFSLFAHVFGWQANIDLPCHARSSSHDATAYTFSANLTDGNSYPERTNGWVFVSCDHRRANVLNALRVLLTTWHLAPSVCHVRRKFCAFCWKIVTTINVHRAVEACVVWFCWA